MNAGTQSEVRMPENVRAMAEQAVNQSSSATSGTINKKQRYFKVPFNPRQVRIDKNFIYLISSFKKTEL